MKLRCEICGEYVSGEWTITPGWNVRVVHADCRDEFPGVQSAGYVLPSGTLAELSQDESGVDADADAPVIIGKDGQ